MSKTLFDKLYKVTEDAKKMLKKPTVCNKIKRHFEEHYDKVYVVATDAYEKYVKEALKMSEGGVPDVNVLVQTPETINNAKVTQEQVAKEYKKFFGEDIKGTDVSSFIEDISDENGEIVVSLAEEDEKE